MYESCIARERERASENYEVPKTGQVAMTVNDLADRGNMALSTIEVDIVGYKMTIAQMYFDDDRFIVVLQSANGNQ